MHSIDLDSARARRLTGALATLALALAAGIAAGPAHAAPLPPSITADTTFAPSGIASWDFQPGMSEDLPAGAGADSGLDRLYAVGETERIGQHDLAVIARHADGKFDTSFGGNGRLPLDLSGGQRDLATSIAVLPNHRLRVAAATTGALTGLDVVVVGLKPDGSLDETFGVDGVAAVLQSADDDVPTRIAAAPDGRLALTGATGEDTFVAVLNPDGSPSDFGADVLPDPSAIPGVVVLDRGAGLPDRGVGIAWRPGGTGPVALLDVTDDAAMHQSVLHAFTGKGADDPAFATDGERVLNTTGDLAPASLIAYGGRLWAAATASSGTDADMVLARVNGDGSQPQLRPFDIRVGGDDNVASRAADLTVLSGDPDTLVVAGSVHADPNQPEQWAAAAFNDLEADLQALATSDVVIRNADDAGSILGVAASPTGAIAASGSLQSWSNATSDWTGDTSFGMARLLVDAEKRCDLALTIIKPLEVTFVGLQGADLQLRVANHGTRSCGGEIAAPAPYVISAAGQPGPVATGAMEPGASRVLDVRIDHSAAKPAEDTLTLALNAPADAAPGDNRAGVHARFSFCDATVTRIGTDGLVARRSTRRFEFTVRNRGTAPCRDVRVEPVTGSRRIDVAPSYTIRQGLTATDTVLVLTTTVPRIGRRKPLTFRVRATDDVQPENDLTTAAPLAIRGADSNARKPRGGGRRFTGRGFDGQGRKVARALLGVRRVDVAIQRLGGRGCRWVASTNGGIRKVKPGVRRACDQPVWLTATGTHRWHLTLAGKLPKGRYVLLTRAVQAEELAEHDFSAKDHNRIRFRVR
jgi:hypothetical protein